MMKKVYGGFEEVSRKCDSVSVVFVFFYVGLFRVFLFYSGSSGLISCRMR